MFIFIYPKFATLLGIVLFFDENLLDNSYGAITLNLVLPKPNRITKNAQMINFIFK